MHSKGSGQITFAQGLLDGQLRSKFLAMVCNKKFINLYLFTVHSWMKKLSANIFFLIFSIFLPSLQRNLVSFEYKFI